jgi:hypothetical protein
MLELATITLDCFSRVTLREQIETIAQQAHEFRHAVLDAAVPDDFAASCVTFGHSFMQSESEQTVANATKIAEFSSLVRCGASFGTQGAQVQTLPLRLWHFRNAPPTETFRASKQARRMGARDQGARHGGRCKHGAPAAMLDSARPRNVLKSSVISALATAATSWR